MSSAEDMFVCKTTASADIVILVDGSWSIGRINFRLVRTFLENLVKAFAVEVDRTRIGETWMDFYIFVGCKRTFSFSNISIQILSSRLLHVI